jgi:hypothetical protein
VSEGRSAVVLATEPRDVGVALGAGAAKRSDIGSKEAAAKTGEAAHDCQSVTKEEPLVGRVEAGACGRKE